MINIQGVNKKGKKGVIHKIFEILIVSVKIKIFVNSGIVNFIIDFNSQESIFYGMNNNFSRNFGEFRKIAY